MSAPSHHRPSRWPARDWPVFGLALVASWSLFRYFDIALHALRYPFALEWMEGGVVHTVHRVLDGQALYAAPSVDFVAYIYPPFYFWVTALFARLSGLDFFAGRFVSFAAFALCLALVFRMILAVTQSRCWGLVGAGLLTATFVVSGGWFHLARIDSLYQALLLLGFLVLLSSEGIPAGADMESDVQRRWPQRWRKPLVAGALFGLAFLTKQSALIVVAPVLLGGFLGAGSKGRRTTVLAGLAFVAVTVPVIAVLHVRSEGWSSYFLFNVAPQHGVSDKGFGGYWRVDLWSAAIGVCGALIGLAALCKRRGVVRRSLWLGFTVGIVASSWSARIHSGGAANVLMPAFLLIAILAPIGFWSLVRDREDENWARSLAVAVAVMLQFWVLSFAADTSIPSPEQRAQTERFDQWVFDQPGEVLVPDARWIELGTNRQTNGMGMAARDLLRLKNSDRGKKVFLESLTQAISTQRYSAIVLSERDYMSNLLEGHYQFSERIDGEAAPVTGWGVRNRFVFRPVATGSPAETSDR